MRKEKVGWHVKYRQSNDARQFHVKQFNELFEVGQLIPDSFYLIAAFILIPRT